MEWAILFTVSWILFFLFADWKKLKINIWCGIAAVLLQMFVDTKAIDHDFYTINRPVVGVLGSSLFFIIGPVTVIGILFGQFQPVKKWWNVINICAFTALYSAQEIILLNAGALVYNHWCFTDSLGVNLGAMTIISWVATVILERKGSIFT